MRASSTAVPAGSLDHWGWRRALRPRRHARMPRPIPFAAIAVSLLCSVCHTAQAAPLQLDPVGTFQAPTYVTAPAGDVHRVFVVERGGRVQVLDDGVKHQFLDLGGLVSCCVGERGLSSVAFPPDYATSGRF